MHCMIAASREMSDEPKLLLYDYYDGDKEPAISDKNSRKSSKIKITNR